jgi:hypothetical protein
MGLRKAGGSDWGDGWRVAGGRRAGLVNVRSQTWSGLFHDRRSGEVRSGVLEGVLWPR